MPITPESTERSRQRRRFRPSRGISAVLGVVIFLAAATGTAAYVNSRDGDSNLTAAGENEPVAGDLEQDESADAGPRIPPLFTDPGSFVGQDLHLVGTVDESVDPYSFRVVPTPDASSEPSLLVVYNSIPAVEIGQTLELEGTVTEFEKADVEVALETELPAVVYETSSDDYVLAARTVKVVGNFEGRTEVAKAPDAAPAPAADPVITSASVAAAEPVTSAGGAPPAAASSSGGQSSGGSSSSGSGSGSGPSSEHRPGKSNEEPTAIAYTGDDTSGQYSDEVTFEARVTRGKSPVRGVEVVFELRSSGTSRELRASTNRAGVASATSQLTEAPGTYKLVATHRPKTGRRVSDRTIFIVEREDTSLALTAEDARDDEQGSEGEGSEQGNGKGKRTRLVAVLSESDEGRPLEGQTLSFFADGELLGSAVTDSSGVATFEVPPRDDKSDSFEARFDGNDYYLTSEDAA